MDCAAAVASVASLQPPYSLIQRKIEAEILPFCRVHDIGVIVYSPLERGLLAGAVPPERTFPPGDHRATHRFFTVENRRRVLASLDEIRPIAERHGVNFAQLVINWTILEPGITAALVGARNPAQAVENARAMTFRISDDERRDPPGVRRHIRGDDVTPGGPAPFTRPRDARRRTSTSSQSPAAASP